MAARVVDYLRDGLQEAAGAPARELRRVPGEVLEAARDEHERAVLRVRVRDLPASRHSVVSGSRRRENVPHMLLDISKRIIHVKI